MPKLTPKAIQAIIAVQEKGRAEDAAERFPRIVETMPEAEYHLRPEISKHDLDLIEKAPLLFRHEKDNPKPLTEDVNFGSLTHLLLLEPERLDSAVAVLPANHPKRVSRRILNAKNPSQESLDAIAWWAEWRKANAGKQNATAEQIKHIRGMKKSLITNPSTRKFLEMPGQRECSLFWEMEGVKCRARLDIFGDGEVIPDFKTTGDATEKGFARDIGKHGYHKQGAYYTAGAKALGRHAKSFVLVAVEPLPPYLCTYHILGPVSLSNGAFENRANLNLYRRCLQSGKWPNIADPMNPIECPMWAL